MKKIIRVEDPNDTLAIYELIKAAFLNAPHTDHNEQIIVEKLRKTGKLTLSHVIEIDGKIVAHGVVSPVAISDGSLNWFGLGPVAVSPDWQRQGLGSELIRSLLSKLQSEGANGCVVLGDPLYYQRFGFKHNADLILSGVPQEYFQVLQFGDTPAKGDVSYLRAFFE